MGFTVRVNRRMAMARRKLTTDQIIDLLTSDVGHKAAGSMHGISDASVIAIRYGDSYKDVAPHIPRWERREPGTHSRTCWKCKFCSESYEDRNEGSTSHRAVVKCGFGFPDPSVHGASFARFCNCYQEAE